jgi:signal peptidase I
MSNNFQITALEGLTLLITDRFLLPMFAGSGIGEILRYGLQAFIFLKVRDHWLGNNYPATTGDTMPYERNPYKVGRGTGPVIPAGYA